MLKRYNGNGYINSKRASQKPRGRARTRDELPVITSLVEAKEAVEETLRHFGRPERDRGIWIWYCRRIGVDRFMDLALDVISSARQHEIYDPPAALQCHLQEHYRALKLRAGLKGGAT